MAIPDPPPPQGAPDWIVTFADMISLLVTFFILLLTFSSMDEHDAFLVHGNLTGTAGTLSSKNSTDAVKPPDSDIMSAKDAQRGAKIPHTRSAEELLNDVSKDGLKASEEHSEVNLSALKDGMRIRYDARSCFMPGSVELPTFLAKSVGELGRVLEHYAYTIVVEGHTDNAFKPTAKYPTAAALSVARADAVASAMIAASKVRPLQLQIMGHGESKPLVPNDTPEGRRSNRRVEIRIMSLSQARVAALQLAERSDG
ncbi:MAG: chemotaxis protein MotB [Planctomycetota bacterium]|jgi:chemotaxis protein MotB